MQNKNYRPRSMLAMILSPMLSMRIPRIEKTKEKPTTAARTIKKNIQTSLGYEKSQTQIPVTTTKIAMMMRNMTIFFPENEKTKKRI